MKTFNLKGWKEVDKRCTYIWLNSNYSADEYEKEEEEEEEEEKKDDTKVGDEEKPRRKL